VHTRTHTHRGVWQESKTNGEEGDAVAVAKRMGALLKQQRELQTKLRGVQHDIHRTTRR
jgi:hypothetical protein